MLNVNSISFKDLETRGFLVIPNFIDTATIEQIKNQYNRVANQKTINKNYAVLTTAIHSIESASIPSLLESITQHTNIGVDLIKPFTAYFNNQAINFDWHQDHEPYYMWQDSYNAINCWIPIIKPDGDKSGISIIPHDTLEQHCPDIFKKHILGKGAKAFLVQADGTTIMRDDSEGNEIQLPFDVNQLAESPILHEGDLLILRQDIFHKTQDTNSNRVAISIRCVNSNTVLSRDTFLSGSKHKQTMIKNNQQGFAKLTQKFINENRETILLAEI